jgi:hypothetical protein
MPELLEDPVYWNFILEKPRSPFHKHAKNNPISGQWVVYFRQSNEDRWKRRSFRKYKDALKFFWRLHKKKYYDFNLGNRRLATPPPKRVARIRGKYVVNSKGKRQQVTREVTWKPKISGDEQLHHWCKYCRRPTIFTYFSKHPALRGFPSVDPNISRCTICGISANMGAMHL